MEDYKYDYLIGLQVLNEYKIVKKLGEGTFGKVYEVKNQKSDESFAAKLVSKNYFMLYKRRGNFECKFSPLYVYLGEIK